MHPEKCKKIWKKILSPSRMISSFGFGCEFGGGILGRFWVVFDIKSNFLIIKKILGGRFYQKLFKLLICISIVLSALKFQFRSKRKERPKKQHSQSKNLYWNGHGWPVHGSATVHP